MQNNAPGLPTCHRFRDTTLDFSPFTSLDELNSAIGPMVNLSSLRAKPSVPSLTGTVLGRRLQRSARGVSNSFASRNRPNPPPLSQDGFFVDSTNTLASSGLHRRRRKFSLPRIQVRPAEAASWENLRELSPPPYSRPRFVASEPCLVSPVKKKSAIIYKELEDYSNLDIENEPLHSRYTQCIELSLEDYFHGKTICYGYTRKYCEGKKTSRLTLNVVLPPGCQKDTVFCFTNVGHELPDGTFQDIHLIFVEKPHELKFIRAKADLSVLVRLPWTERLNSAPCRFSITGVDGKRYSLEIDYRASKMISGFATFQDAGMPLLNGKGRGKLTIEWEISSPPSNDCENPT
ncbi:hypothetical protein DFP72DRAFT_1170154 [Ephemerocybe angulata]|uniref:Chaperone DnaJ C-terminal domain-containing protein n=1 Tax=Ephemerocybe angulata TaxID=980116 RepID=A0A8H6M7T1_9AGAR|nr:hypothetical protein DFP72DRAFT_1170154 [Tulosesus angulatus]